jgi:hypothetical protein
MVCSTGGQPSLTKEIMESITKRLPVIAFVLAAFAAVAFTSPKEEANQMYGFDGTDWYLIEGQEGVTYLCDQDTQPGCLFDAVNGNPVDTEIERKFVNISLVPIEDQKK